MGDQISKTVLKLNLKQGAKGMVVGSPRGLQNQKEMKWGGGKHFEGFEK